MPSNTTNKKKIINSVFVHLALYTETAALIAEISADNEYVAQGRVDMSLPTFSTF